VPCLGTEMSFETLVLVRVRVDVLVTCSRRCLRSRPRPRLRGRRARPVRLRTLIQRPRSVIPPRQLAST
jgi:hypothetical protein